MKKLISIALAVLMLAAMATTAFAANLTPDTENSATTAVGFVADPAYTVTIPETITLSYDSASDSFKGSGVLSASSVRLGKDAVLTVAVDGDFILTSNENATLAYEMTVGSDTTVMTANATVTQFATSTTEQSVTLNYSAANPEFAGAYTDTLTFTISAPSIRV